MYFQINKFSIYMCNNYKNKKSQKITHLSLSNLRNIILRKYNYMSKIFPKINLKFYSNVTTYNQTYEYI